MTRKGSTTGSPSSTSEPKVIRYRLRHLPQGAFAATRPGSIAQIVEPAADKTRRDPADGRAPGASRTGGGRRMQALVSLAVVAAAAVFASTAGAARPAARLAPDCQRDVTRTSACQLVSSFFLALNAGHEGEACTLLGNRLRKETRGADCPRVLASARGTPYQILAARHVTTGVVVLVKVGFHEFDHFRMLTWRALVGAEGARRRLGIACSR